MHPGATEVCNGRDDNCDGQIDENGQGVDTDGDGVANLCDNCPLVSNPSQADSDGNGDILDGKTIWLLSSGHQALSGNELVFAVFFTDYSAGVFVAEVIGCASDADCDGVLSNIDCDDSNPSTFPGAPEISDGIDNQCPGDPGYGAVDETFGDHWCCEPSSTDCHAIDARLYCWPRQAGRMPS